MSKKLVFGPEEATFLLEHISERSEKFSGERLSPFAVGYLSSLLKKLAEISPAVRRELASDIEYIKEMKAA